MAAFFKAPPKGRVETDMDEESRSQVSYRWLHSLARASMDDDGCTLVCQQLRNCESDSSVEPVNRARLPRSLEIHTFSMASVDSRFRREQ